ncbi:MAG: C2H2-type zinc finger protein [Nitrososphaera sp.]
MHSGDETSASSAARETVEMDVTNESVHTSDDIDIGTIEAINRNFIVVRRGYVHVHYYYIPMQHVEGWDEHVVWLRIPEEQVKQNFERGSEPSPSEYYVQGTSYEQSRPYLDDDLPLVPVIEPKHRRTLHSKAIETKSSGKALAAEETTKNEREFPSEPPSGQAFTCPLCETGFASKDELSTHVASSH